MLTELLQRIYNPASPDYRHYLTPEQFAKMFGPTEQDYQAVVTFAKTHGLTVTGTHPNRMLLDVDGSVADIEKAFNVTMRVYQHPTEARTFYAPDVEPSLDLAVPVLRISGLNNYSLPRPRFQASPIANVTNGEMPCRMPVRGQAALIWATTFARRTFRIRRSPVRGKL